ncbi:hypothetical protein [Shewanella sp. S23-S33]|uniref:hypothetical protein n=1 Tax=Shewanella sp. S23-S33 TaxID=3342769 RepID=UPI00372D87EF
MNKTKASDAAKARARKQAQREREKALDIAEVRLKLSASERADLDDLCRVRAGDEEPYTRDEYVRMLIQIDKRKLAAELVELENAGPCTRCGESLPGGCKGLFKGEPVCWHWPSNPRLRLVVQRPPLDLSKWINGGVE